MENLRIKAEVLETKGGKFTPQDGGKEVDWKNALVMINTRVLKFKSKVDLKPYVRKTVTLEVEIFVGDGLAAGLRIVGVKE